MTALIALIKREYLEHRGAFLYAPALIVGLLALSLAAGLGMNRFRVDAEIGVPSALKFFEIGFLGVAGLWFLYLLFALFFYYADAFHADRRNNAMLFWKSMPVSDFGMLFSKLTAGLTIFPALIFAATLLSAVLIYIATMAGAAFMPRLVLPDPVSFLSSAGQVTGFVTVYLVLGLLWYLPFFAWVGLLSAQFGRWSMPLAFLIPGLVGLAEKLLLDTSGIFSSGHVLGYLSERATFGFQREHMYAILTDDSFDMGLMVNRLLSTIDWAQFAGGLGVAALFVYLASELRRRSIAG